MSLRSSLKRIAPRPVWRLARSLWHVSDLLAADRSQQICADHGIWSGAIAFSEDVIVWLPDNAVANSIFRMHLFERGHRAEMQNFLDLSEGCAAFIDVGASGGVFSAVFARSRPRYGILSVEPDEPSNVILAQVRERNCAAGNDWIIAKSLLADSAKSVTYESSGYGGEIAHPSNRMYEAARLNGTEYRRNTLTTETLTGLVARHGFRPDIVKFDIESYEHDVICSSAGLLQQFRPRIALELHIEKLGHRGFDPWKLVGVLNDVGYRRFPDGAAIEPIVRAAMNRNVLHMTLAV
jgi:FkbM family methyltransferase